MSSTTSTTTTVVQVAASDVVVGDLFASTKARAASGTGQTVARITTSSSHQGPRVQLRDDQGRMIRSCHVDTKVWVARTVDAKPIGGGRTGAIVASPQPTAQLVPQQVPAADIVNGQTVASTKADLANGNGQQVVTINEGQKARRFLNAQGQTISRPNRTTKVWVLAPGTTPAPAADPVAAADQDKAATDAAQARLKELRNLPTGRTSRQQKEMEKLEADLGTRRTTTGSKPKAAAKPGSDDAHRAMAQVANDLGNPAAKITGPNVHRLRGVLTGDDVSADRKTIVGMKVATLAKYARSGDKADLGKAGLSDRFREVSRAAGPDTFYGKKLASMLVAVARAK